MYLCTYVYASFYGPAPPRVALPWAGKYSSHKLPQGSLFLACMPPGLCLSARDGGCRKKIIHVCFGIRNFTPLSPIFAPWGGILPASLIPCLPAFLARLLYPTPARFFKRSLVRIDLRMDVCMYVPICVCLCVYMYVCIHVCIFVRPNVCRYMYACMKVMKEKLCL